MACSVLNTKKCSILSIGSRSRDGFGFHVTVSRSRNLGLRLLNEEDLSIFVLFFAVALNGTIGDNSEDPKHPEEDADTASENKCNGSSLPGTEGREGDVDAS